VNRCQTYPGGSTGPCELGLGDGDAVGLVDGDALVPGSVDVVEPGSPTPAGPLFEDTVGAEPPAAGALVDGSPLAPGLLFGGTELPRTVMPGALGFCSACVV
jgi:hypothetical protein